MQAIKPDYTQVEQEQPAMKTEVKNEVVFSLTPTEERIVSKFVERLTRRLPLVVQEVDAASEGLGSFTFKISFGYNKNGEFEHNFSDTIKTPEFVETVGGEILDHQLKLW